MSQMSAPFHNLEIKINTGGNDFTILYKLGILFPYNRIPRCVFKWKPVLLHIYLFSYIIFVPSLDNCFIFVNEV